MAAKSRYGNAASSVSDGHFAELRDEERITYSIRWPELSCMGSRGVNPMKWVSMVMEESAVLCLEILDIGMANVHSSLPS